MVRAVKATGESHSPSTMTHGESGLSGHSPASKRSYRPWRRDLLPAHHLISAYGWGSGECGQGEVHRTGGSRSGALWSEAVVWPGGPVEAVAMVAALATGPPPSRVQVPAVAQSSARCHLYECYYSHNQSNDKHRRADTKEKTSHYFARCRKPTPFSHIHGSMRRRDSKLRHKAEQVECSDGSHCCQNRRN